MVAYIPPKQAGKYKAIASSAITNGKPVVVNADGTVSASFVAANAGSPATFESANITHSDVIYDTNSDRVVIVYGDEGNSGKGTAIVGTVSGTSLSFGTPVVFEEGDVTTLDSSTNIRGCFDSSNNKIVIAFHDGNNSNYAKAIVGNVDPSDNSITFGTAVQYGDSQTAGFETCVFDSNSNKVVVSADDQTNNVTKARVGTVSGTSISFGTAVQFAGASAYGCASVFDSSNNKVVFAYYDGNNSNYGTAVVATVSGTDISFGTEVVFQSAVATWQTLAFDSTANKVVIAYCDNGNSSVGTAIVGTVSGTGISFGSETVFQNASTNIIDAHYNPDTNKTIIICRDASAAGGDDGFAYEGTISGTSITFGSGYEFETTQFVSPGMDYDPDTNQMFFSFKGGSSSYGLYVAFTSGSTANLTSENYIGIASGGTYPDTAEATIDVVGTVNKDQSGLTAGQTYYVQTDGTLGTTADDPSVVAGTAISATELIVKG
jgi:hypothetical protein